MRAAAEEIALSGPRSCGTPSAVSALGNRQRVIAAARADTDAWAGTGAQSVAWPCCTTAAANLRARTMS
jgi:hypothetical protein